MESDPFGDIACVWSFSYFFYNKKMKRILYLSCRAKSKASAGDEVRIRRLCMLIAAASTWAGGWYKRMKSERQTGAFGRLTGADMWKLARGRIVEWAARSNGDHLRLCAGHGGCFTRIL
eukprot:29023-Chlamydomonas_euryale.AAC.3